MTGKMDKEERTELGERLRTKPVSNPNSMTKPE